MLIIDKKRAIIFSFGIAIFLDLFLLNRFRYIHFATPDNFRISVLTIITLALFFVLLFGIKKYRKRELLLILLFIVISLINSIIYGNVDAQYFYALAVFIIPILFLGFPTNTLTIDFWKYIKVLNFISFLYCILAIISALYYSTMLSIVGDTFTTTEGMVRASLPLGSSISISYYANINLPFALMLLINEKKNSKRVYYAVSVLINIATSLLLLSRTSMYAAIITVILFIFFVSKNNLSIRKKGFIVAIICIFAYYLSQSFDLSRLGIGVFGNGNASNLARSKALELGIYIWKNNIICGTGMGSFFHRSWEGSNTLFVDGVHGLIDPHNSIILLLSEVGLVGVMIVILIWKRLWVEAFNCESLIVKKTMIVFFLTNLFLMLAGSQIVNSIGFALLVYTYCLVFLFGKAQLKVNDDLKNN